ncbi:ImmA/IrrE family metallo-endopeptidase [Paraburkholderia bannensis]|nr:ImmA/IrrE family metallo-endopeptidase [Paraburkholderia bannensis]RQM43988.1 ImmA/IrrE family metallo-endopeptidase [Paraburkholderia bannensis]
MTHMVRILKSDQELEAALQRMATLMEQELLPGSEDEAEFELLKLVISDYESKRVARPVVTPLQAIEFRMEQQRLTRKDLEPYIGSQSKVSEVLSGKRPLSLQMIRRLHDGLGIPAQALLGSSENLKGDAIDEEADYAYDKFPLKEMRERGLLKSDIKDKARELVRAFLQRVAQLDVEPALLRAPLHQSGARTMDTYALLIWRAVVVDKAHCNPPQGIYRADSITPTWLRDLAKLSRFERGPLLAQEYLSQHGICLVIEPPFKKTYLDGCAMLDGDRPIIGLTLRHDRLDNFWFALLHEVVHVQKHLTAACRFIADNLDDKGRAGQAQEDEADAGARDALIPPEFWSKAKVRDTHDAEDAKALASQAGVHPCIVAGRMRYETGNWRLLSGLITEAGSVKACFSERGQ